MKLKNISILIVAMICIGLTSCSKEDVKYEEVIELEQLTQPIQTVITEEVHTETEQSVVDVPIETEDGESDMDYYAVCTTKSKDEVENFVEQIINCFELKDWKTLSSKIHYPITINEKYYASEEAFLETDWSNVFTQEFIESVVNSETTNLFCSWRGISVENGSLWFGQIEDELLVDAINFYDEAQIEEPSEGMVGHWTLDYDKTANNLKKYSSMQELFGTGVQAGSSLDIREDNQFSMGIAIAVWISGTYEVEDDVIKIYYSDERGNEGEDIISYVMTDEQQYIVSYYDGEEMYWKKLSD